jgi:DNA repair exonuclease SbcCD ATPase subunit
MNKALHALVYVFVVLAAAALWFEMQLNAKRGELGARNRLQENYIIQLSKTIEAKEPEKGATVEIKKDSSPVEARIVDTPDQENVLDEYKAELEQANLETFNWGEAERDLLRTRSFKDDPMNEGKYIMDGDKPETQGSEADRKLAQLVEGAKNQQARLNTTRYELTMLRGKLEGVVKELNELKQVARQDKVSIEEKQEIVNQLEGEKAQLEGQITKYKGQVDELNTEITSLKDEVNTAKEETEMVREDYAKAQKQIEDLKNLVQTSFQSRGASVAAGSAAVTSLSAGEKGKIIEADNDNMFAIVQFSEDALAELKGGDVNRSLPILELGIKRPGFNGPAGEFVGRIRLRQEVKGSRYVVCDILAAWEQDQVRANDIIFAD